MDKHEDLDLALFVFSLVYKNSKSKQCKGFMQMGKATQLPGPP